MEKTDLPKKWRITPEQLALNDEAQQALKREIEKESHGLHDIAYQNSAIRVKELATYFENGLKKTPDNKRAYGEALAGIGRFDDASEATKGLKEAKYYADIWHAIFKENNERCDCIPPKEIVDNFTPVLKIYSVQLNGYANLYKCCICGFLNVK